MPELKDLPVDRCPPGLDGGDEWLRERLDESGIQYVSDGGAGYVFSSGAARVWVTGFLENEALLESAFRQLNPLWGEQETRVFGRPTYDQRAILYWRAGGVDFSIVSGLSQGDVEPQLRDSIDRLIRAAENHPYGEE